MAVKITSAQAKFINPKEVDFECLPDDRFYSDKIYQSFSLLPKIYKITKLIKLESHKIEEIAKTIPDPKIESKGLSVTIQGPTIIDSTTLSSLEFSLLLLQFTYIEALCNIIAECAIRKNTMNNVLKESELNHLSEKKVTKNGIKTSFVRIEDKIKDYIELLSKANKIDFKFDKSSHHWEGFKFAKKIRDDITHPRNGVRSNVEKEALIKMSKFIYWYTEIAHDIFTRYFAFENYKVIESYTFESLKLINESSGEKIENIKEYISKHNSLKQI